MKKAILYDLNWSGPIGNQPYVYMQSLGLNFEGGIVVKYGLYLGIIEGEESAIQTFIDSQEFKCVSQTNESAIEFYSNVVEDYTIPGTEEVITRQSQIDNFISKLG